MRKKTMATIVKTNLVIKGIPKISPRKINSNPAESSVPRARETRKAAPEQPPQKYAQSSLFPISLEAKPKPMQKAKKACKKGETKKTFSSIRTKQPPSNHPSKKTSCGTPSKEFCFGSRTSSSSSPKLPSLLSAKLWVNSPKNNPHNFERLNSSNPLQSVVSLQEIRRRKGNLLLRNSLSILIVIAWYLALVLQASS
jgi:hypothetical protein